MRGRRSTARAIAIRCRWPPDSCTPRSPTGRVVAAGQPVDELVGARQRRRAPRSSRLVGAVDAVADVLGDRPREQRRLLHHRRDPAPKPGRVELAHVAAADADAPFGRDRRSAASGSAASTCRIPTCRRAPRPRPARCADRSPLSASTSVRVGIAEPDALERDRAVERLRPIAAVERDERRACRAASKIHCVAPIGAHRLGREARRVAESARDEQRVEDERDERAGRQPAATIRWPPTQIASSAAHSPATNDTPPSADAAHDLPARELERARHLARRSVPRSALFPRERADRADAADDFRRRAPGLRVRPLHVGRQRPARAGRAATSPSQSAARPAASAASAAATCRTAARCRRSRTPRIAARRRAPRRARIAAAARRPRGAS